GRKLLAQESSRMRPSSPAVRKAHRFHLDVERLDLRLPISEGIGPFLTVSALAAADELANLAALAPSHLIQITGGADVYSTMGANTSLLSPDLTTAALPRRAGLTIREEIPASVSVHPQIVAPSRTSAPHLDAKLFELFPADPLGATAPANHGWG